MDIVNTIKATVTSTHVHAIKLQQTLKLQKLTLNITLALNIDEKAANFVYGVEIFFPI